MWTCRIPLKLESSQRLRFNPSQVGYKPETDLLTLIIIRFNPSQVGYKQMRLIVEYVSIPHR
jgi:hypothetical protein